MGFIPIILFTLAFIFLWGIVNYNSLRKTRNEITQLQERIITISLKRKDLCTRLLSGTSIDEADKDNLAIIMKIAEIPSIDKKNIGQTLRNEVSRTQLTTELNALLQLSKTDRHPQELVDSLIRLTNELNEIHPGITDLYHNYHEMTDKPPSRFIARLFGFKS